VVLILTAGRRGITAVLEQATMSSTCVIGPAASAELPLRAAGTKFDQLTHQPRWRRHDNHCPMGDDKNVRGDLSQDIRFEQYAASKEPLYLDPIRSLMERELSEPYSIYVYHYFLHQWPELCFMVSQERLSSISSEPSANICCYRLSTLIPTSCGGWLSASWSVTAAAHTEVTLQCLRPK